uniref:N-acetyltransferase domain-containing protein n=1 Tax=Panagrolaimus sp. ES5 TaxID=591445 RepID=A0AC34GRX2_9BILA
MNFVLFRLSNYRNPQLLLFRYLSSTKNNNASKTKFNNFVNSTNFILDYSNENGKREKLFEKEFSSKVFTYEKATVKDLPLIIDFYSTYFNHNEVLCATLKMTNEEAKEIFTVISKDMETFMLRDGNKFIGMMSAKMIHMSEYPIDKGAIGTERDYGKLIDSGPFKYRTNNLIQTLLEVCESKIYKDMKFPCIYYHGILGGIHPKYFAQNLGLLMTSTVMEYCKKQNAKYYIGVSTSDASLKLHLKL